MFQIVGWVPGVLSAVAIALIVGGFLPQYWTVLRMTSRLILSPLIIFIPPSIPTSLSLLLVTYHVV